MILSPEEQAKEFTETFAETIPHLVYGQLMERDWLTARECALITCNEVIKQWEYIDAYLADLRGQLNPNLKYWYEVRKELINKKA